MNDITNLSDESGPDGPFIVGNRTNILSVTFCEKLSASSQGFTNQRGRCLDHAQFRLALR